MGLLGLPNFLFDYWAANISRLNYWISAHKNKIGPMWATMELESNSPLSPVSIISKQVAPLPSKLNLQRLGPVIRNSLKIWLQFRKYFHLNQPITPLPLVQNHLFALPIWKYQQQSASFGQLLIILKQADLNGHFATLQMNAIAFLTLMAPRLILMQWKLAHPPSLMDVLFCVL